MGATASQLAVVCDAGHEGLRLAAMKLAEASGYHQHIVSILKESGALVPTGDFIFSGCAEAAQIASWIAESNRRDISDDAAIGKMRKWASDLVTHAHALIAGQ